nr:hypothetical protein [Tanacetum cinerariifolium]
MLIFSHAPLFLWAEAIATACYTQNRSIIHRRFNKTPYDLIQYISKLGAKGDVGFFIGYSANSVDYRVYNWRTKEIMETMNVMFDELLVMAFEQNSSKPVSKQQGNLTPSPTASATDNVPNVVFEGDLFVNPFATPSTDGRTKGVVIRDPEESTTRSIIIHSEAKSKDKAQARKNMMIYLNNVVGFKMDYFKGMSYDDIRPVFEKYFNSNVAFLQKTKEQMDEEDSRLIKRLNETQEEKAAKKQKLDEEVEELKRHLQIVPNKEDDV